MSRVPWGATRDSLWVVYRSFRLDKICGADQLWNEGEKVLAHIHLALARLPTVILVIAPPRNLAFCGCAPCEASRALPFGLF
jgi:hypothetical protein